MLERGVQSGQVCKDTLGARVDGISNEICLLVGEFDGDASRVFHLTAFWVLYNRGRSLLLLAATRQQTESTASRSQRQPRTDQPPAIVELGYVHPPLT